MVTVRLPLRLLERCSQCSRSIAHSNSQVFQMMVLFPEVCYPRQVDLVLTFTSEYPHRTRSQADAHTTRVSSYPVGRHLWRNPHHLPHLPQNVLSQGCSRPWVRRIYSHIYPGVTNIYPPLLFSCDP